MSEPEKYGDFFKILSQTVLLCIKNLKVWEFVSNEESFFIDPDQATTL